MRPARVLLVDDNRTLCKTMSYILERKGYEVQIAGDGDAAIERVREQAFDLILMDIKMPDLNGVETYRRIKDIRPDVTVLMMTAYAVPDLVQAALKEGAIAVIYKPFDMEDLLKKIGQLVNGNTRSEGTRSKKR